MPESNKSQWDTESKSIWEEEPDEDSQEGDTESAWNPESGWIPNVHLLDLKSLVKRGYPEVVGRDDSRFSIGSFPKGFRLVVDSIRDKIKNGSDTKVHKITYCHGLAIISHHPQIVKIFTLYKELRRAAWKTKDFGLIDKLEERVTKYEFAREAKSSQNTMGILKNRTGMVGRLSSRLGMVDGKLYIGLMITSMMTWPKAEWYDKMKEEEDRFFGAIDDRLKDLEELNRSFLRPS